MAISSAEVIAYHKSFPEKSIQQLSVFFGIPEKEIDKILYSDLTPAQVLKRSIYEFFDSYPSIMDGIEFFTTKEKSEIFDEAVKKFKPQITHDLAEFYFNEWQRNKKEAKNVKSTQLVLPFINLKKHRLTDAKVYDIVFQVRKQIQEHPKKIYNMTLNDFARKYNLSCAKSAFVILGHVHEKHLYTKGSVSPETVVKKYLSMIKNKVVSSIDVMVNTGVSFTTIAVLNKKLSLGIKIIKVRNNDKIKVLFRDYLLGE